MLLAGRRAVVTGATRGIGAAVARALDAQGAHTLLVARDQASLDAMAKALTNAVGFAADLRDAASARLVGRESATLLGGPVDVLVNNAGIFAIAPIDETDETALDAMLALNLGAPFRLLRAILPAMRAAKRGHIVTIGSIADRLTFAGNGAYAATKYGTRALHEVARAELKGSGVRTTLVSPGPVDTPIWDPLDPDGSPGFTKRADMLRPEQVADAVIWALTRDESVNVDELRLSHS